MKQNGNTIQVAVTVAFEGRDVPFDEFKRVVKERLRALDKVKVWFEAWQRAGWTGTDVELPFNEMTDELAKLWPAPPVEGCEEGP